MTWESGSKHIRLQEMENTREGLKIRRYLVPLGVRFPLPAPSRKTMRLKTLTNF